MPSKLSFTERVPIETGHTLREYHPALPSPSPYLAVVEVWPGYMSITHVPSGVAIVRGVPTRRLGRLLVRVLAALPVDYSSEDQRQVGEAIRAMPEWYEWVRQCQRLY